MKTAERARELAQTLVALGQDAGVKTTALLTDMNTPLGLKIGNTLEVEESIEVLQGGGPADVVELTVELATEMLRLAGLGDVDVAANLKNGKAHDKWVQMIQAQGGDLSVPLPQAHESHVVVAASSGYLNRLDALQVGVAAWRLGAGRARKEDAVQFGAGITLHAKPGQAVVAGQPLMTLFTDEASRFEAGLAALEGGFEIGANNEPFNAFGTVQTPNRFGGSGSIVIDRIEG
jgi:thymidine phosphorylase